MTDFLTKLWKKRPEVVKLVPFLGPKFVKFNAMRYCVIFKLNAKTLHSNSKH